MLAREVAELLIQAGRVVQAGPALHDLGPAEWMALRFFARANMQSRKPSALAEFEISSRAAASHVVGRLEKEGYLLREQSPEDGRSYRVELTEKGHAALHHDPIERLVTAVRLLGEDNREALHRALRDVIGELARSGTRRQFDVCRDCAHLTDASHDAKHRSRGHAYACRLFEVTIESEATNLLCAHFRRAAA